MEREDEETLLLQFPPQVGFAVGNVDALDDLAAGGAEPTTEFHSCRSGSPQALDLEVSCVVGRKS